MLFEVPIRRICRKNSRSLCVLLVVTALGVGCADSPSSQDGKSSVHAADTRVVSETTETVPGTSSESSLAASDEESGVVPGTPGTPSNSPAKTTLKTVPGTAQPIENKDSETVPGTPFWTYRTGGELWSTPIVLSRDDGSSWAVFGSDDRRLHAVDLQSGKPMWRTEIGTKIREESFFDGEHLWVQDEKGTLYRLDPFDGRVYERRSSGKRGAKTWAAAPDVQARADSAGWITGQSMEGRRLWRRRVGATEPRALVFGREAENRPLYVVSGNGGLHAFDAMGGTPRWSRSPEVDHWNGDIRSKPVEGGAPELYGHRLFATGGGFLWCLSALDGQELWRRSTHEFVSASPVQMGTGSHSRILVAGGDSLFAFDESGVLLWRQRLEGAFRAGPVAVGDAVAVGSGNHLLTVFDRESGQELWRFETDGFITSSLAAQDRRLIFGSVGGTLFGLEAIWPELVDAPSPSPEIKVGPTFFDGTPEIRWQAQGPKTQAPGHATDARWLQVFAGRIEALDLKSGRTLWKKEGTYQPVSTVDSRLGVWVTVDSHGRLVAFNVKDGAVRWTTPSDPRRGLKVRGIWSSPEGRTLVGTETGEVAAFSTATGELLWRVEVGAPAGEPRSHGDWAVVGTTGGRIVTLDVKSGRELWRFTTHASVVAPPLIQDDVVLVGDTGGTVYALDPAIGGERWSVSLGGSFRLPAVGLYSTVFLCGDNHRLTALDKHSGALTWHFEMESHCTGAPSIYDGMGYVGTGKSSLHAVNAINGEELWRLHSAAPILGAAAGSRPGLGALVTTVDRSGRVLTVDLP